MVMNEFEEAMQNVLDYGMEAIGNLSDEQIKLISKMFEGDK
jgi:hypothetical protein